LRAAANSTGNPPLPGLRRQLADHTRRKCVIGCTPASDPIDLDNLADNRQAVAAVENCVEPLRRGERQATMESADGRFAA
jgi:hypothetical protein